MSDAPHSRAHLFIVRVWIEDLGDAKTEWRGQVKHVLSGEVHYFRDWSMLLECLREWNRWWYPLPAERLRMDSQTKSQVVNWSMGPPARRIL